ncbi:MAG: endonuclease/exonuclease/phosphatase family protein [Verrucomicrobia subdivision 3 bacterium]|nr:endonuclease/exonuclease/phosphatase family protein [Limisphaerales bacterium]
MRFASIFATGLWLIVPALWAADLFRVATYNVENHLLQSNETRPAKPQASRDKVRDHLLELKADVVAVQEMGGAAGLADLQKALRSGGLDYPHSEIAYAWDTNIQVAVLSRFPMTARRSHTNDSYLLFGKRFRVGRAFVEVDIRVNPEYSFTLMTTHLKSRRQVAEGDEAQMREQEALLLREKIDALLKANPDANLVVLGDLNDVRDSKSTRAVIGRGRNALIDTRPAERNGDNLPNSNPRYDPRNITWTHFYGKEDTYSRIDYILLSRGMAREWIQEETYVFTAPNWGLASDHRPVTAGFWAENR